MNARDYVIFGLPVFFGPIALEWAISAARGRSMYRLNELTTNLMLSVLSILGSLAVVGATLWLYVQVYQHWAPFPLAADSAATWLLAFIVYDFLYYWAHRIHHRMAVLWAVHVVHHSGEDMNLSLALRQSAFGDAVMWVFFIPMALLGIPPEAYLGIASVQLVYQYLIHNTYVPALGWLELLLVTPSQHRVHHSRNHIYIDKNYGNVLVVWDRLFGSYQPEVPEHPVVYGLRRSLRTCNPLAIDLQPIAELVRRFRACRGVADKLRCLFLPADWAPRAPAPDFPPLLDDGPSAGFRKHDPAITRGCAWYCAIQCLIAFGAFWVLLWYLESMTPAGITATIGFVVTGALVVGGLLDGRRLYWRAEVARIALAGALGAIVVSAEGLPPVAWALLGGYVAVSLGFALSLKASFTGAGQPADPAADGLASTTALGRELAGGGSPNGSAP